MGCSHNWLKWRVTFERENRAETCKTMVHSPVTFLRVIPTLTHYSDIVSDIPSGSIYGILYLFRHFFWHSIWHLFWHILTFFLAFYLASIPTFYLAFYLPFCLVFYLVSILIFSLTWALPDLNRKRQITDWDLEPKMCITNHYYTLYVCDEYIGIATSFPFLSLSADATSKAQGDGTHSPLQLRLRWVKSASRQVSDPELSFERKTWWQGLCAWRCDFANAIHYQHGAIADSAAPGVNDFMHIWTRDKQRYCCYKRMIGCHTKAETPLRSWTCHSWSRWSMKYIQWWQKE